MRGLYRGYLIGLDALGEWVYVDNEQPVSENPNRKCGHCNLPNTPDGHDGCLGELPDVMNACCGHGNETTAYIQFVDQSEVRGKDVEIYLKCKKHDPANERLSII